LHQLARRQIHHQSRKAERGQHEAQLGVGDAEVLAHAWHHRRQRQGGELA
jgi:hypothetical protein